MKFLGEHIRVRFKADGFDIQDGSAIADSGYGSGGIVVDLDELEKELAEAAVRKIGEALAALQRDKILTQFERDQAYERLRVLFIDTDWMPNSSDQG